MAEEKHLDRLPYWSALLPAEREEADRHSQVRRFGQGQLLHGGAEACLGMIQVQSGRLRAYLLSPEGREVTLFRLLPGDSCVLSASCVLRQITFDTMLAAEEPSTVLIVGTGTFARLMETNLAARCYAYAQAAERSSAVIWVLQQILFARFDQRLAGFLLEAAEHGGPNIALTQTEIAREVSSAREVVARMLRQFADDGLVEVYRGGVRLLDLPGLRALL